jgi:hypothetical protein
VRSGVGGKSETNRITCWEIYVPDTGLSGPGNIIGGGSGQDVEVFDFVDLHFLVLAFRDNEQQPTDSEINTLASMVGISVGLPFPFPCSI